MFVIGFFPVSRCLNFMAAITICSDFGAQENEICHCFLFSAVQSLSHVRLFATPWIAAHQASLSITHSRSLLKLVSFVSVMPSNHLILCCSLLLLPSIFPSIRVFSNESGLRIRWPKYWSFSFSISPSNEHPGLGVMDREAWCAAIHGVTKSWTQLSDWTGSNWYANKFNLNGKILLNNLQNLTQETISE